MNAKTFLAYVGTLVLGALVALPLHWSETYMWTLIGAFFGGLFSLAIGWLFYCIQTKDTINLDEGIEAALQLLVDQNRDSVLKDVSEDRKVPQWYTRTVWLLQRKKCYYDKRAMSLEDANLCYKERLTFGDDALDSLAVCCPSCNSARDSIKNAMEKHKDKFRV